MSLNLITDRTAADLAAAREIIAKVQRGETLTEAEQSQFDAGLRGCYNASDLNRVEAAVKSIAAALNAAGYAVAVEPVLKGGSRLPSGYTQVEYIESTGTQYIDTGYVITSENMRVVIKFAYTAAHSDATLFGSETTGITGSGEYSICPYGNPQFFVGGSKSLKSAYEPSLNEVCTLDITANNGTLTDIWNGTRQSSQSYTQSLNHTYSVAVFGNNISGAVTQKVSMKLYSFQIYDGNVLVRDFISRKTPSGEIGLYDTITQSFYGNDGTGVFTAGPEIETESHDWQTTDIIRLSQWRQYLANVQALRDAYYTLAETGQLPDAADRLDYTGANTIEKILADIDLLIGWMKSSYRRCGTFQAGNNAAHLPLKGSAN